MLDPWDVFVIAQHFRALAEGSVAMAALEPLARRPEHMGLLSAGAEHARTIAVAAVARAVEARTNMAECAAAMTSRRVVMEPRRRSLMVYPPRLGPHRPR